MRAALVIALGLLASPAFAMPPPDVATHSPAERAWWRCQTQPDTGVSCCSEADGHSLKDSDWRIDSKRGIYQVRVEGRWFDIPPNKVVNETKKCGVEPSADKRANAKVWYSIVRDDNNVIVQLTIYCFETGFLM